MLRFAGADETGTRYYKITSSFFTKAWLSQDIANHQLTQLRPWLMRNTGSFEIKAFKMRFGPEPSLHLTRQWLHSTHNSLVQRAEPILHPAYSEHIVYTKMTRNQQVYIAVLRGIVDVVFNLWISSATNWTFSPPSTPVASSPTSTTPASPTFPPTVGRPETLYLDKARLASFSTEAADVTVLYMFMLLFRQLAMVDLGGACSTKPLRRVNEEDVLQLRQELLDIGPAKMAACFIPEEIDGLSEKQKKDLEQRRSIRSNMVLQVAKKASDLRRAKSLPRTADAKQRTERTSSSVFGEPPDQRLMNIGQRWVEANMQPGSTLSVLLHNRIREVLFDMVVSLAYPGRTVTSLAAAANGTLRPPYAVRRVDSTVPAAAVVAATPSSAVVTPDPSNPLPLLPSSLFKEIEAPSNSLRSPGAMVSSSTTAIPPRPVLPTLRIDLYASTRALTTAEAITESHRPGMEGILEDARDLAEKMARLALIHLNTFLGMYESDGFFVTANDGAGNKWVDEKWTGGFGERR